ncbi:MAG TPA: CDP-glucose 4,6-dehydratase [Acidimicrobiia bacterium]|nr:CDP-glucose 4,6-dehydratase [Acidimicrobiia bacterium]
MTIDRDFWSGRKVFLTGHTGFKGAWLAAWLTDLGADVTGFALAPYTDPALWRLIGERLPITSVEGDVRDGDAVAKAVANAAPSVVLHLAAQPIVRTSYLDPAGTFATNVQGTVNTLEAVRTVGGVDGVVVITSDKVYENRGTGEPHREDSRLGGDDPYSASKAAAEHVVHAYRTSYRGQGFPPMASVRAGNVVGGGDWSTDRLVPDVVRALDTGEPVSLRYPQATRPWQHVLDPLSGYLVTAQELVGNARSVPPAVNFGPPPEGETSVVDVVERLSAHFDGKPGWVHPGGEEPHEAPRLTLSIDLARVTLGWRPRLDLEATLAWTAEWYAAWRAGGDPLEATLDQIRRYEELAPGTRA